MEDRIQKKVSELKPTLIQYRRDFHKFPEVGWTEFRSASIIIKKLKSFGYSVRMGADVIDKDSMMGVPAEPELARQMERAVSQGADPELTPAMAGGLTGIVADLDCGQGPTVAFQFDMDALPTQEAEDESHLPYREGFVSHNRGIMHACGHDGHMAIGLGVAQIIAEFKDTLKGQVRLIFQPAEEGVRGALPMVKAGVVKDVDYIFRIHIGLKAKELGEIVCGTDQLLASTKFNVAFKGVPAHAGAEPHVGRNALSAAACAILNLHAIERHGEGASRIAVGTMTSGQVRNQIPAEALLTGETRGETTQIEEYMFDNVKRIIEGAAVMYDVGQTIEMVGRTGSGASSPAMVEKVRKAAEKIDFFSKIVDNKHADVSDDYSVFMSAVQTNGGIGSYALIGADLPAGNHNYHFDYSEAILAPTVDLFVRILFDLIGN